MEGFMSHFCRRTLAAAILAAALLSASHLTACGERVKMTELSLSQYTIIRSDRAEKDDIQLAVELRKGLEAKGVELTMKTDFLNTRLGETAGEYELLFGDTIREESSLALEGIELDTTDFLVKSIGNRIVVLAGSETAYSYATKWICESFDADSGMLKLPEDGYYGKWIPPLEGLTVDGIPLGEFSISFESLLGWELETAAESLCDVLFDLTGETVGLTEKNFEAEYEIFLGSSSANSELPCGYSLKDGKIYLTGRTTAELKAAINSFTTALGEAEGLTDLKEFGGINMNKSENIIIKAVGETAKERGASLVEAFVKAESLEASETSPKEVTIELADGIYELSEPIVYGNNEWVSLTVKAADGAKPIITCLTPISKDSFTKVEGTDYYMAKLDTNGIKFRDIYKNNVRVPLAAGETYTTVVPFDNNADRKDPVNARGYYVDRAAVEQITDFSSTEFTIYVEWEAFTLHAASVDYSDTKVVDGHDLVRLKFPEEEMSFFPRAVQNGAINRPYFIANNTLFLTPGTCVCDYDNGILYYCPENGDLDGLSYSVSEQIIKLSSASNVTLEGLTFSGSACLQTAESGYFAMQANGEKRKGVLQCAAVLLDNCTNIKIDGCTFDELGGNGVQTVNYLKSLSITDCKFDHIAMCAITVGNHDTGWSETNANYDVVIENNMITNIGFEYPTVPAVYISHVDGMKLNHNTIDNCSYSGISVGWGWSLVDYEYGEKINIRNAEIAYNRIINFMSRLRDGAAIYVLGANCTVNYTETFNSMHDNFSEKADYSPNGGHICGYYLDGSSSNWHVYDNVIRGAKFPLFAQFHVPSQYNHNVVCERIYSTEAIDMGNASVERNVSVSDIFTEPTLEELYEKYPEAKEIMNNAGAR